MQEFYISNMYIDDLIALCHIIDEYDLMLDNFIKVNYNRKFLNKLIKVTNGRFCFNSKQAKKFYKENKIILDLVKKYSNISRFLYNCGENGKKFNQLSIDRFYQYMLKNSNNLNHIIELLEKIKQLGFQKIILDENVNFTDMEYKIDTIFNRNFYINYLDNIEVIPNYEIGTVKYKTRKSDYEIELVPNVYGEISFFKTQITVNNLLFDPNKLPQAITKETTFDEIVKLNEEKQLRPPLKKINSLTDVKSKQELKDLISDIKNSINEYSCDSKQGAKAEDKNLCFRIRNIYFNKK